MNSAGFILATESDEFRAVGLKKIVQLSVKSFNSEIRLFQILDFLPDIKIAVNLLTTCSQLLIKVMETEKRESLIVVSKLTANGA